MELENFENCCVTVMHIFLHTRDKGSVYTGRVTNVCVSNAGIDQCVQTLTVLAVSLTGYFFPNLAKK